MTIKPPYHFVPVKTEYAVADKPVWHDGSNDEQLYSGELRCTMTTLTPLLGGNYQYSLGDADREVKQSIRGEVADVSDKKSIIEPIFMNGKVVIPGSALKGMIRSSLSALMSVPMERVSEKRYTYRPNVFFSLNQNGAKYKPYAAVIEDRIERNGCVLLNLIVLQPRLGCVIFLSEDIKSVLVPSTCEVGDCLNFSNGALNTIARSYCIHQTRVKKVKLGLDGARPLFGEFYLFKYYHGIDQEGILFDAFNRGDDPPSNPRYQLSYVLVPGDVYERPFSEVTLNASLMNNYGRTIETLMDDKDGHLSNLHPLKKNLNNKELKTIKSNLSNLLNTKGYLQPGDLIFIEAEASNERSRPPKVTSFGHNLRYRWRYRDSIHIYNGAPRQYLTPINDERGTPPKRLTAARLLFGYTATENEEEIGMTGLGGVNNHKKGNDFRQLTGRIAFNSAVEIIDNARSDRHARFLNANKNFNVFLPILGQPRASAVEYYLTQNKLSGRTDGGTLCTYGDTLDDNCAGELNGRKFYLHNPNANQFETNDTDIKKSDQSSVLRYVSKSGTDFKFTIRFKNLRDWELALLLIVIQPSYKSLAVLSENNNRLLDYLNKVNEIDQTKFAHKLGHGRPLGLGSVDIKVDKIRLLNQDGQIVLDDSPEKFNASALLKSLKAKFANLKGWQNDILLKWMKIHQFAGRGALEYPKTLPARPKRDDKETIFEFHTRIRNAHIKNRKLIKREDNPDILATEILKDLPEQPPFDRNS